MAACARCPSCRSTKLLADLLEALRTRGNAVLQAPPGAGKTTRVPPAVAASGVAGGGQILVLEPRRIAARAAARRIAEEQGWTLGREVGWQIRFERNFTRDTRILFVTEGILVQRLQRDPFLDGIGAVLFDEIHERSLFADLSLALVRRVQLDARPELKLLPMSATLDGDRLAAFLDAPIVTSAGRLFPIAVEYLEPAARRYARSRRSSRAASARGSTATPGDLLVFLPGVPEIRRAEEALATLARERDLAVVQLYGDLPSAEQDRVLRPGPRRKVVLATNVAETSITVDGVTGVIDSGWVKESSADPATGLERLALTRISRASAEQRAGRAGRQAPGWCLRLWSEHEHRGLQARSRPEIRRADLAWTALQLAAWGERDLAALPLVRSARTRARSPAAQSPSPISAPSTGDGITPLGRRLAEFPLHPRLALLVLEGERRGVADDAALVAALLSDRDPTATAESRISGARTSAQSDLLVKLDSLRSARSSSSSTLLRTRDALLDAVRRSAGGDSGNAPSLAGLERGARREPLQRAIFIAWADRLARRREPGSDRAVMVGGRGVRLARESSVKEAELFVCVSLDDRSGPRSEALVRIASAVERDWLPPERLREATVLEFDEERERVVAHRRTYLRRPGARRQGDPDPRRRSRLRLARGDRCRQDRRGPAARRRRLGIPDRPHSASCTTPAPTSPFPRRTTPPLPSFFLLCRAGQSRSKSSAAPPGARRCSARSATPSAARSTARPRSGSTVPSGNQIRVDYSDPARPVLAARIQELFGLAETPRLARGRVPVLLHLLAPNGRPQQVTDDLASFWKNDLRRGAQGARRALPAARLAARSDDRPGRAPPATAPRPPRSAAGRPAAAAAGSPRAADRPKGC